jgi:hypothetical protein
VPIPELASLNTFAKLLDTPLNPIVAYTVMEGTTVTSLSLNMQLGDDDLSDFIVAVWNVNAGTVVLPMGGIAIDGSILAGSEDRLLFGVDENRNAKGLDLNTDGDTSDFVPYWVNLANPAIAYGLGFAMTTTQDAPVPIVCGHFGVMLASESGQGPVPVILNSGDTDTSDNVAFVIVMEGSNTQSINTHLATEQFICFPNQDFFFLTSSETGQGGVDLNGDMDTGDIVPILFTVQSNGTLRRGHDGVNIDGPISFQVCPDFIRIWGNAKESNIYGDINEDGDLDDYGIVVTRISRGEGKILSFRPISTSDSDGMSPVVVIDDSTVIFPYVESMFSTGLNGNAPCGDSDTLDTILMYVRTFCY